MNKSSLRMPCFVAVAMLATACSSGPIITEIPTEAQPVDAPYANVLVVSLFQSPDIRRRYERQVVERLLANGIEATALSSLQNDKTPVNRDAVVRQVERVGADAVLVTQMIDVDSSAQAKKESPAGSYTFRATSYVNVYTVEQTVYDKVPSLEIKYDIALQTDVYSAGSQQRVWAQVSERHFKHDAEEPWDYSRVAEEAQVVVDRLARAGLIGK